MSSDLKVCWRRFRGAVLVLLDLIGSTQIGRIKDAELAVHEAPLAEVRTISERWRIDYNHARPHSAQGRMAPEAVRLSPAAFGCTA